MAKRIQLKKEKLSKDNGGGDFEYAKTIIMILSRPGGSGLTIDDVRQSMKIIDRLEKPQNKIMDSFVLEDSEWTYLNKVFKDFRWSVADPAIVNLGDAIEQAVNVEVGE